MCRVRVHSVEEGLVPAERVVQVPTTEGPEELVVASSQVSDNAIAAAFIGKDGDRVLIELPRESASGRRRVWVREQQLVG